MRMRGDDRELAAQRFAWLDAVRAVAALTVVINHVRAATLVEFAALPPSQKTVATATFFAVTRLGTEAVIVFFVLSGFLVGGPAARRIVAGAFDTKRFATARATRIFVPYVPALAITAAISAMAGQSMSAVEVLGGLCFVQGVLVAVPGANAPLWSLAYEAWFYALAGALGALIGSRGRFMLAWFVLAASAAVFAFLEAFSLLCWLAGAAAFFFRGREFRWRWLIGGAALCAVAASGLQLASTSVSVDTGRVVALLPPRSALTVALGAGVAVLLRQLPSIGDRVGLRGLERTLSCVAPFSYSLYLIHYPFLRLLVALGMDRDRELSAGSISRFVGVALLCCAAGWAFYLPFERQIPRIRSWLGSRPAANPV